MTTIVLEVLEDVGVLDLVAGFAVGMTYSVVKERNGTVDAEVMAEENKDIRDKSDDEDTEVMNPVEAKVVEAIVVAASERAVRAEAEADSD